MLLKLVILASIVVTVNSLRCIFGGQGTVNGQSGASTDTNVTCRSSTKYCVKLESDTTLNGEHVKGIARGCDQEMPGSTRREFCKAEGCTDQKETSGNVKVCCCSKDFCNGASRGNSMLAFFASTILFIFFAFIQKY